MKTKLLILLATISVGSNVAAMEWFSPEALNALNQAKTTTKPTTTKPTEFIIGYLSKSFTVDGDKKGLEWIKKSQPWEGKTTKYIDNRNGVAATFTVLRHDTDEVGIYTHFERLNPALKKEYGFEDSFKKPDFSDRNYKYKPVDKWTRCGVTHSYGPKYTAIYREECETSMSIKEIIDQFQKIEQK